LSETLFTFPFNHDTRPQEEAFTLISKKLEKIGLKTMLFLKNIEKIKWKTPLANGYYSRKTKNIPGFSNVKKVILKSTNLIEEYIVIEKPISIENKKLKIEVAYKLAKDENDKEGIVADPDSKLVVFFPTEKETFLNFIIQGPFKTTPNRENIPIEDRQNKKILNEIGSLVGDSLLIIKKIGYLNVDFLNILPINSEKKEQDQIYEIIYNSVKEKLISEKLLPTSSGKYTNACNALLSRGKQLTKLLDSTDIQKLFSKKHWLNTNITRDKAEELRNYIINELDINEVTFEDFAKQMGPEFLQAKNDKWIINLYTQLLDYKSLWGPNYSYYRYSRGFLATKPIIRTKNNEHVSPFNENGKIQVYLPTKIQSDFTTVKQNIVKNKKALKFLEELGLTKPNLFDEIKKFIIPKYEKETTPTIESYFRDFEKLLKEYENTKWFEDSEFRKILIDVPFIYTNENNKNRDECFSKASHSYFRNNDLEKYFKGNESIYFVSDKLYKKFGKEKVKKFLEKLEVLDYPRRIKIQNSLSYEEKKLIRGSNHYTEDISEKDYEYDGMNDIIESINSEKSYLLWKLLLKSIEKLEKNNVQKFFEGEYKWLYCREHSKNFNSRFLKTLKNQPWLVDKNKDFKKPSEIAFSELSDNYIKDSPNIDIFKDILDFDSEITNKLPKEDQEKLNLIRDIPVNEVEAFVIERKQKTLDNVDKNWIPESSPDEIIPAIIKNKVNKIITDDLSNQVSITEIRENKKLPKEDSNPKEVKEEVNIDRKGIGKWGEECVYCHLRREYQKLGEIIEIKYGFKVMNGDEEIEVIWLNRHQEKGKGYDFVIKKGDEEIKYIEVKTKTSEELELIEVTGTQWEFARKLFEQGEGKKYLFYIVFNAGSKENTKIHILKNPFKLWKDGKISTYSVKLKLKK
jgi:hypothetical protein